MRLLLAFVLALCAAALFAFTLAASWVETPYAWVGYVTVLVLALSSIALRGEWP